jgi:hypothetical protein
MTANRTVHLSATRLTPDNQSLRSVHLIRNRTTSLEAESAIPPHAGRVPLGAIKHYESKPRGFLGRHVDVCRRFLPGALGETKSSPGNQPLFGFACAFLTLVYPLGQAKDALLHNVRILFPPMVYVSLLISGWTNPFFFDGRVFQII